MQNLITRILAGILLFFVGCKSLSDDQITIVITQDSPHVRFAVDQLITALNQQNFNVEVAVQPPFTSSGAHSILFIDNEDAGEQKEHQLDNVDELREEGFDLQLEGTQIAVIANDEAGLMYGGLELAEQISVYGLDGIKPMRKNPYMAMRGTKFNIPLDVRTPSYTDPCDVAQKNIPEMWNFNFWKEYIDNLAKYRYNFISLWSLQPFPSLVRTPGFEDIALDDVQRSTVEWEEYYSGRGIGFDAPEILANPEVVKQISFDEKMAFWQKVMAYGKSRNVDFYVVTWNIFVNGTDGKYGVTDHIDNQTTRDYFRKSVKQLFVTYPDLAGVGLTTGENMLGADFRQREDWAFETYAQGVLDAAKEMPDRQFRFIHRQHMTGALDIAEKFKPLSEQENVDFIFSFKYAKAHVMSAVEQPYHTGFVEDIKGMKTIWTLRNDDNYLYRWGAPDFVRQFIKNIPYDVSQGYYYGSDQWIWGREFTMKESAEPRQIEIAKHWYHWMQWGRLGYDPDIENERFIAILNERFPEVDAQQLFTAWQRASMVYPTTTGFHWGPLDFQWYIESCKSRPGYAQNETGFHDVNRFINLPPHKKSGFQSIPDYAKMQQEGGSSTLKSPLEVAEMLHQYAETAIKTVESFGQVENKELAIILHDIKTMALLGDYYGYKISGATQLGLFRELKDEKYQKEAISQLTAALEAWKKYTAASSQQNINPIWLNRVGYVNWEHITEWAAQDIEIASAG